MYRSRSPRNFEPGAVFGEMQFADMNGRRRWRPKWLYQTIGTGVASTKTLTGASRRQPPRQRVPDGDDVERCCCEPDEEDLPEIEAHSTSVRSPTMSKSVNARQPMIVMVPAM